MKLDDMLKTLRTIHYERIEIRDLNGNELLTCPADSEAIAFFKKYAVKEWFPHGAANKDASFTVYIER